MKKGLLVSLGGPFVYGKDDEAAKTEKKISIKQEETNCAGATCSRCANNCRSRKKTASLDRN